MYLSETTQYTKWISQFPDTDKLLGKLLVDSINYVDEDTFTKNLYKSLISTTNQKDYYALYAVRERNNKPFWPINNSDNPEKINPSEEIGSEGDLSHFIRDISRKQNNFLDSPSMNKMKDKKVRHIIFVDDFSGSGSQISNFVDWFYESKTIKSWFSFGYIDFEIYLYAITENALKKLQTNKKIKKIQYEIIIGKGSSLWTEQEYNAIENFCIKYSKVFGIPESFSLGYKESFSLIMFSHKCPNNVPGIIWYSKSKKKFIPLVEYRPNFYFNKIENLLYSFSEIIHRFHYFFETRKQIKKALNYNMELLLILEFLNKRKYNEVSICKSFNISIGKIHIIINKLLQNGWIDSQNKITKKGKLILKYFKKNEKKKFHLEENNDFYYPKNLRAPV